MQGLVALALIAQGLAAAPGSGVVAGSALPPAPALALDPAASAIEATGTESAGDGATADGHALLDAQLRAYFAGEKHEGYAWLGAAVAAAGASTALMASSSDAAHGASYPLLDIGVVQLGAAIYLLWRTDDQVARLSAQLAHDPCAFLAEEPARMRRVARGFSIYLPIEATTLVGGAAMAGFGATSRHDFLQGAGWGLVAQSVAMLIFDQFAAGRAVTWQHQLDEAARVEASHCPAR